MIPSHNILSVDELQNCYDLYLSKLDEKFLKEIREISCITDILHNKQYGCGGVTQVFGDKNYMCCPLCGNGIIKVTEI